MRKQGWWADVALVAALLALVLAIMCLAGRVMRAKAADAQAQARRDLCRAASAPATERPAATVIFEPPEPEEDKPAEKLKGAHHEEKMGF